MWQAVPSKSEQAGRKRNERRDEGSAGTMRDRTAARCTLAAAKTQMPELRCPPQGRKRETRARRHDNKSPEPTPGASLGRRLHGCCGAESRASRARVKRRRRCASGARLGLIVGRRTSLSDARLEPRAAPLDQVALLRLLTEHSLGVQPRDLIDGRRHIDLVCGGNGAERWQGERVSRGRARAGVRARVPGW